MSIRPAVAGDHPAFARLFDELETGDPTPTRQVWSADYVQDTIVYQREGQMVGYVFFQVLDGQAYVRHLVTAPRHRGQGIGRALMNEVAARTRQAGVTQWSLNVKPDNVAAIALYERMGMAFAHDSVAMRMRWDVIERLPGIPAGVQVQTLVPASYREVEQAVGLPSGQLAAHARRSGVCPLQARHDGAVVGVSMFIPGFPGAHPFVAPTAAVARALLETMRPHADPRFDYVQLVLENAAHLARGLEVAGAWRHLEIVHWRGEVPSAV